MSDPTTNNVLFAIPTNNSDTNAWDVPVNNNATAIDGFQGGVVSIGLTNVNVTLTKPAVGTVTPGAGPTQSQNAVLRFTGTLTGNVIITLPLPGYYIVENNCSATATYYVQLSGGSGKKVGAPPGESCHVYSDGTDVKYVNMGRVGTYLDLAVSGTQPWMSACTTAPWLICDGTVYNISDYSSLGNLLGSTFGGNGATTFGVPDLRGRWRIPKDNQGGSAANRITVAGGNFDGTVMGNSGGAQNHTLVTGEIPSHTHTLTDPGHTHANSTNSPWDTNQFAIGSGGSTTYRVHTSGTRLDWNSNSNTTGVTIASTGGDGAHTILNPGLVHGITLIKT